MQKSYISQLYIHNVVRCDTIFVGKYVQGDLVVLAYSVQRIRSFNDSNKFCSLHK